MVHMHLVPNGATPSLFSNLNNFLFLSTIPNTAHSVKTVQQSRCSLTHHIEYMQPELIQKHNSNFLMFIGNGFTWINSFFTCERPWQNNPIKPNFTIAVEWNDKISQVSTGATSQQTISVDVVLNLWHQGGNELTLPIQTHTILGETRWTSTVYWCIASKLKAP